MTTPKEVRQRIVEMSLSRPAWGCNRISDRLKLEGVWVSAPTVQNILNKKGIGSRYERWLKLEEETAEQKIELSAEQVAFIEKQNPCFRERDVQSTRPGEPLNQDACFVGHPKGGRQEGLLACRGGYLLELRLRVLTRLQTAGGRGGGAA